MSLMILCCSMVSLILVDNSFHQLYFGLALHPIGRLIFMLRLINLPHTGVIRYPHTNTSIILRVIYIEEEGSSNLLPYSLIEYKFVILSQICLISLIISGHCWAKCWLLIFLRISLHFLSFLVYHFTTNPFCSIPRLILKAFARPISINYGMRNGLLLKDN